jgi:hypothetical protein
MATQGVTGIDFPSLSQSGVSTAPRMSVGDFKASLAGAGVPDAVNPLAGVGAQPIPETLASISPQAGRPSPQAAVAAYSKQAAAVQPPPAQSGWEKYKDDQLLRNPGGRDYNLGEKRVTPDDPAQESFSSRLSKDFSDSFANFKNFFKNLLTGSETCYRDKENAVKEDKQRGMASAIGDFFKDLGGALSFGAYRPNNEKAPEGFVGRLGYSLTKLKDAFLGDLAGGVTSSLNHAGQSLLLSGWRLLEAVPDATIGNLPLGRRLTTKVFDNGQVFVEYITDVVPSGDAWLRVHAWQYNGFKLPVLYNLKTPEEYAGDARWEHVRNTPFRKTVETLGSLVADAATAILAPSVSLPDDKRALR